MSQGQSDIGQSTEIRKTNTRRNDSIQDDFVLEKSIFNNIFEKDIRRIYIYKKAERLAKALHLTAPAFVDSVVLRTRIDSIAMALIDLATVPVGSSRAGLSRELLALSSILSMARTSGMLSRMNVDLITHEAHILLQEIAEYEEPRLFFEEAPTLSDIAKRALSGAAQVGLRQPTREHPVPQHLATEGLSRTKAKGHNKDIKVSDKLKDRREAVLSVIRSKGNANIKDISRHIRGVSEKTVQRELSSLIKVGLISKRGERRWSTYSLT
jgi:DNA-binding transcriptional ArsR family regulator